MVRNSFLCPSLLAFAAAVMATAAASGSVDATTKSPSPPPWDVRPHRSRCVDRMPRP